ncbi:SoxR reducing system RseC family protein [Dethiothermospora halolimnae]|uniref:SoxR reducing system RseC family protein n=1 Tax=Dethiothermospora halolimnae TaxID=3114390 RepID=UPI003CCB7B8F
MEQIGYVSKIDGDKAQVDVRRVSSCGEKCASCGSSCNIPATRVTLKNTVDAKEGDFVEIEMETSYVIKSAYIVYAIPLILMILGIGIGIYGFKALGFASYEILSFSTGLIALIISFFVLRKIDKKIQKENKSAFKMTRILDS